jgi:hypothetical protein
MNLQLQLLSLEHFHSSALQAVLQTIHYIFISSFPFHFLIFILIFFFPSYNHFLSCVTCPYISVRLRKTTCFRYIAIGKSIESFGYVYRVGKNTVQAVVLYVSPAKPFGRYCSQYTSCNRRNGPDFGRVFLMLKYTDITQNTYVQS